MCACGEADETDIHYLLYCNKYSTLRSDAKNIVPLGSWNTKHLLHGSNMLYTDYQNRTICITVQKFIISNYINLSKLIIDYVQRRTLIHTLLYPHRQFYTRVLLLASDFCSPNFWVTANYKVKI